MTFYYNAWLVVLSVAIAVIASYTTLSLSERVVASSGRARSYWLAGGTFSMGFGIWSMHFIGMLAFHLPIPVAYDTWLTVASLVPAFAVSAIALYSISVGRRSSLTLIGVGSIMGVGIAAMHYTGMAAMRMFPAIRYDPGLFWLSILIAVGASIAALEIAYRLKDDEPSLRLVQKKLGSALVMGIAIAGMHYTGMSGANFAEGSVCLAADNGIDQALLTTLVGGGSMLVLLMTLLAALFGARLADQNAIMVRSLRQANEALHERALALAEQMTSELQSRMEHDRLLAAVVEQTSDAIVTCGLDNCITSWNKAASGMFGYRGEEILGTSIDGILEMPAGPQGRVPFSMVENPADLREVLGKKRSGGYLSVALSTAPLLDEREVCFGYILILRDITHAKLAEARLQQAAAVFDNTTEGVIITDEHGIITAVNAAFTSITGYSEEESVGRTAGFTKSGLHDQSFYQAMWQTILDQGHWLGEVLDRRKSGETYPKWLSINTVRNDRGEVINYVGVFNDITQLKEAQTSLQHMAQHDFLTDLPNRLLFEDRLGHAINRAKRDKSLVSLLFLDLDRFKNINDSLGHIVGDHLLVAVAQRIQSVIRDEDTLARLGGDEFIVILEAMDRQDQAAIIAEKIVEVMGAPFNIDGYELFVTTSIGISSYPNDGRELTQLLKNADAAMYKAKEDGRNKFCFYSAELTSRLHRRLELEGELHRALEHGEFALYFQPLVSANDGAILGAEALIRWIHPSKGSISPAEFLPVAEECGLLPRIEEWVINFACRQLRHWWDQGLPSTRLAVNLSSEFISYHNVADRIATALEREQLSGSMLQFEITENSLVKHTELLIANLQALDRMGITIAIDDFGTGYSSMAYLKRFAVSKLKIDQSFVRDIASDPNDKAIVKTIILMGHGLGLTVTAEGVESEEQKRYLVQQGCDELQGYLFSKPMPTEQFAQFLRDYSQPIRHG